MDSCEVCGKYYDPFDEDHFYEATRLSVPYVGSNPKHVTWSLGYSFCSQGCLEVYMR